MRWFWSWIRKKISGSTLDDGCMILEPRNCTKGYDNGPRVIEFAVTICEGGYLLQSNSRDRKTGHTESRMMVIDESKDYGEMISDFCKMELLR